MPFYLFNPLLNGEYVNILGVADFSKSPFFGKT